MGGRKGRKKKRRRENGMERAHQQQEAREERREHGGKMEGRDYVPQYYGLGKGKERNGSFEGNEPSSIWEL